MIPAMNEVTPIGFAFPLADGKRVFLRPGGPCDRDRIREGLTRLSSFSRYLRFFTGVTELSEQQLKYLTEIDQVDHVAWCALDPDEPNMPGLGLGRFVRDARQPSVAEFAIVVVDAYHGRGLGRVLLAVLYLLARQRGINTLRGLVLPENQRMIRWLDQLGASLTSDLTVVPADLTVHEDLSLIPPTRSGDNLREMIKALQLPMSHM
jgi:GNAT superfamily N-acetyltransferase